jgi:hypothetical protein
MSGPAHSLGDCKGDDSWRAGLSKWTRRKSGEGFPLPSTERRTPPGIHLLGGVFFCPDGRGREEKAPPKHRAVTVLY